MRSHTTERRGISIFFYVVAALVFSSGVAPVIIPGTDFGIRFTGAMVALGVVAIVAVIWNGGRK